MSVYLSTLLSAFLSHEVSSGFIINGRKCSKYKPLPSGSHFKKESESQLVKGCGNFVPSLYYLSSALEKEPEWWSGGLVPQSTTYSY